MTRLPEYLQCDLCSQGDRFSEATPQLLVRSSERVLEHEKFTVWQCTKCKTIHAKDGVDLSNYYAKYELYGHEQLDGLTRFFFKKKLKFIQTMGIQSHHTILDYGCGSGSFIQYMKQQKFSKLFGYDPFTKYFNDAGVLHTTYDLVMSSDVIEHDLFPISHLETLIRLASPQGLIYIQTPNANGILLRQGETIRQQLQQPFHRHIVSSDWLIGNMKDMGWQLKKFSDYPYFHSWIPFLNLASLNYYANCYGGLVILKEKFHWQILLRPKYWFLAFCGITPKESMQLIFGKA
jgi:2-polyprenyl-3-methyl-5-hydroxy-6-metoxy-1,4-benzoquinol methylase